MMSLQFPDKIVFYRFFRLLLLIFLFIFNYLFSSGVVADKTLTIPDINVNNQNGEKIKFYSDLVKDKTVAINFIYTNCSMTCPLLGYKFGMLRQFLRDKAGTQVHLISISIDPVNDTPVKLKRWSEQFNAGKGWTLVTGTKMDIDAIVKSLSAFAPAIEDHSTMVLMGNDAKRQWFRVDGLSSAKTLLTALSTLF